MNSCWAIIPVKDLDKSKSRLGPALGLEERVALSLEMLERVVLAASETEGISTLVVSRDQRALVLAQKKGVNTLHDRWQDLNASLEGAAIWCRGHGASSIMVLHADLPLIKPEDIAAMMQPGASSPCVVISPCRRQEGTNALFLRPPGIIPFNFGRGSFQAHLDLAAERGIAAHVHRSPTIATDIDTIEDLDLYRSQLALSVGSCR
ncbi:MAG: 2-phospho-L-lactate guanylyltransferase [Dehalococcoidia bacterium]|nr:2-phospho-L-lactate guanylyltransferase [Dehalococcoidia bacterium]